jgi:hypothetical protein
MSKMMKLALAAAVVGATFGLAGISSAAPPPPTQDSVVLTSGPGVFNGGATTIFDLNATSGPSGENPTGRVDFAGFPFHDMGPVTCLAVSGNSATLNFLDEIGIFSGKILTVEVVDNDPDAFRPLPLFRAPTDCSPPSIDLLPLSSGDITVTDAQPLPTSTDQCKKGGYAQFGFKNLGGCVAFVILTRICDALERHGHHLKFCPPRPPSAPRPQ